MAAEQLLQNLGILCQVRAALGQEVWVLISSVAILQSLQGMGTGMATGREVTCQQLRAGTKQRRRMWTTSAKAVLEFPVARGSRVQLALMDFVHLPVEGV